MLHVGRVMVYDLCSFWLIPVHQMDNVGPVVEIEGQVFEWQIRASPLATATVFGVVRPPFPTKEQSLYGWKSSAGLFRACKLDRI
jgi:hypothetical protein